MSGITLRNVTEENHATALVPGAYCWEVHPWNAAWARKQVFHVELGKIPYDPYLCVRKQGSILCMSFSNPQLQEQKIVKLDEVFSINRLHETAPDFDFYKDTQVCGAFGFGELNLSLCTARFKSGSGEDYDKKDSDPVGFGARNEPRKWAGRDDYVDYKHIDISDPIGNMTGFYSIMYVPIHCTDAYLNMSHNGIGRSILCQILLAVAKRNLGADDWRKVQDMYSRMHAGPQFGGDRGMMRSVLATSLMPPVFGHESHSFNPEQPGEFLRESLPDPSGRPETANPRIGSDTRESPQAMPATPEEGEPDDH